MQNITEMGVLAEKTTILVHKTTRDKLVKLGLKHETYDDVILKLITFYEGKGGAKK